METTTVTTKGQLVIPVSIRKKFGIKPGTKIIFSVEKGKIILTPITEKTIEESKGILRTDGKILSTLSGECDE